MISARSGAAAVTVAVGLILSPAACGSHNRTASARRTRSPQPGQAHRQPGVVPYERQPSTLTINDDDAEPHAARSQVPAARAAAHRFFRSYIAFLYGRLPASRLADADPGLRSALEQGHATTTPAERASRPRITRLTLSSSGPPISVVAVAVVKVGCCGSSNLTATLEPRDGACLVVAASG
jgi:hypothetical protein